MRYSFKALPPSHPMDFAHDFYAFWNHFGWLVPLYLPMLCNKTSPQLSSGFPMPQHTHNQIFFSLFLLLFLRFLLISHSRVFFLSLKKKQKNIISWKISIISNWKSDFFKQTNLCVYTYSINRIYMFKLNKKKMQTVYVFFLN